MRKWNDVSSGADDRIPSVHIHVLLSYAADFVTF